MAEWEDELERWLKPFLRRLGHKTRQRMCPLYVLGLIDPGARKSVQPMAERVASGNYDRLHHFMADGVWDAIPLELELLNQADRIGMRTSWKDRGRATSCPGRIAAQSRPAGRPTPLLSWLLSRSRNAAHRAICGLRSREGKMRHQLINANIGTMRAPPPSGNAPWPRLAYASSTVGVVSGRAYTNRLGRRTRTNHASITDDQMTTKMGTGSRAKYLKMRV